MTRDASNDPTAAEVYNRLRRLAREQGRATDELFHLYLLERFLYRWANSRLADQFVLKGGTLLAAYDLRRATRDIDVQALAVDSDRRLPGRRARHPGPSHERTGRATTCPLEHREQTLAALTRIAPTAAPCASISRAFGSGCWRGADTAGCRVLADHPAVLSPRRASRRARLGRLLGLSTVGAWRCSSAVGSVEVPSAMRSAVASARQRVEHDEVELHRCHHLVWHILGLEDDVDGLRSEGKQPRDAELAGDRAADVEHLVTLHTRPRAVVDVRCPRPDPAS